MKKLILIFLIVKSTAIFSQLTHYNWPTGQGEAKLSDKYQVFVKNGNNPEVEIKVLMSEADPNDIQYDFRNNELTGRTFSFVSIAYDKTTGGGLTFRVVKNFGNNSTTAKIAPKSYIITPTVTNNQVTFNLNDNNKFISVNFEDPENQTPVDKWIKHMLMIFVDPPETNMPNLSSFTVVPYSNSVNPTTLRNAGTIYFPPGYYNLRNYQHNNSIISTDGVLTLQNGQSLYIAGGAFVEGLVKRENFNNVNQKIRGRGVLSGRQFIWQDSQGNKPYGQIIEMGKFAEIDGIHVLDSPLHGIVSPNNMTISNLKFLGWHANNDAVRVGQDSEIKNSFMRAVDDFFYNFDNYVHDCVLWAGHNGAVLSYGWGGDGGNTYNSGASTLDNIDIINPEWTGLGNNNGLVASQTGLDYKPFAYNNSSTLTTIQNIRIEGTVPGLVNLKPRSTGNGTPNAIQVPQANLGYLGDLLLKDITVEGQSGKSRIRGQANATSGGATYYTKNINFTNVNIGGTKLTEANKNIFFDIDQNTTQNITFDADDGSGGQSTYTETFNNVSLNNVLNDASNSGLTDVDFDKISPGDGEWFTVQGFGTSDFGIQNSGGNPQYYVSRVSSSQYARAFAYVYNNSDDSVTGIYDLGFDYFFNSSFSNTSNERFGYRIFGLTQDPVLGNFPLTSGSGFFGDSNATGYNNGGDEIQLVGHTELPTSDNWTNSGSIAVDFGAAGTYKYIIVIFGQVFGTTQSNPQTLFGVDNVVLPTQSNPQTLSIQDQNIKSEFSIYPNPVNDILTINKIDNIKQYTIFDATGKQLIKSTKEISRTIDLSNLKRGIYFLEVLTRKNSKKIVKILKE